MAEAFVSFFAIIDPVGNILVFQVFTAGMAWRDKLLAAGVAVVAAFALLLVFSLGGVEVLEFLGISQESFQVAAGVLLLPAAYALVFEGQLTATKPEGQVQPLDFALVPMATPLIAGPGALAAATSLADVEGSGVTIGAFSLVLLLTLVCLAASEWLFRLLGRPALQLASRVVGILLFAIAVDFVLDGVRTFFDAA